MLDLEGWVLLVVLFSKDQKVEQVFPVDQGLNYWQCADEQWDIMQGSARTFDLETGESITVQCVWSSYET